MRHGEGEQLTLDSLLAEDFELHLVNADMAAYHEAHPCSCDEDCDCGEDCDCPCSE